MNILSVDTSTALLNVTIKTDEKLIEFSQEDGTSQHSEVLLPTIIDKCKEANIELKDLDLLVCTRGPGSFTGLRIGMSCLKGLSYGLNKPLVSVSTLEVYASMIDNFDGAVVVALDAKKQRYYLAVFEVKNGSVKRKSQDIDGNSPELEEVLKPYKKIGVFGPDKNVFAEQLKEYFNTTKEVICLEQSQNSIGKTMIYLAQKQFKDKGSDHIGQGPVYIRKSDAEVALEERLKNQK